MSAPSPPEPPSALMETLVESGLNENAARILIAAARLFSQKGYAATSVREIVQEAEVTNPMLYYYFESKEGVFQRLLTFVVDALHQAIEDAIANHTTTYARLDAIAHTFFDGVEIAPELVRFVYAVLFGPVQSRPVADIVCVQQKTHGLLRQVFDDGIAHGELVLHPGRNTHFLSDQFIGMVNNQMMIAFGILEFIDDATECRRSLDTYIGAGARARLLDFFFHGAGTLAAQETP
ncbi:TetR/AcrR family transcriptional regulator [Lujinxingia sediminis]|nr:TetR/AcrR family transcriptional regulator [Lujinxingia sediminis]